MPIRTPSLDALEPRRLLAADFPTEAVQWRDGTHDAAANQVIVDFADPNVRRPAVGHAVGEPVRVDQRVREVDALDAAIDAALGQNGIDVARHLGGDGVMLVTSSDGHRVGDLIGLLKDVPGVERVTPDFVVGIDAVPNDARFGDLWGMDNQGGAPYFGTPDADIDAPEAWDTTTGSADVIVGIIDTGVRYDHPDLTPWVNPGEVAGNGIDDDANGYVDDVYGIDTYNGDADPLDDHGHGTHTAGTVAAKGDNGIGVVGVSWNSRVMGLKFLGGGGSGATSGAVEAVNYATNMRLAGEPVAVTNNSWGGGGYSGPLYDAIEAHADAGILFAAAAGNSSVNNDFSPHYPSSYDNDGVISVAASGFSNDSMASFSNYGLTSVDVAAPGVSTLSTDLPSFSGNFANAYSSKSGTSMATPHVAGVAALLASVRPGISPADAKAAIMDSVDPSSTWATRVVSGGRLNAAGAVQRVGDPGIYGTVRLDADGDGALGTGEGAGVGGVTVWLDADDDGAIDAGEATATTDAGGNFAFVEPAAGTHVVRAEAADGHRATSPAVTLNYAAESFASAGFLQSRTLLVGGVAFEDADGDGQRDAGEGVLGGRTVYVDADRDGQFDVGTPDYTGVVNAPITDYNTTVGQIVVTGASAPISDLDVTVNLDHTYTGDLDLTLVAPDGTRVLLSDQHGGSGENYAGTIFDDEANRAIEDGDAPFAGRFRPDEPLSAFDGLVANGTWQLEVYDNFGFDNGTLIDFTLTFSPAGERMLTTDAAGRFEMVMAPDQAHDLRQVVPDGWVDTTGTLTVGPASGQVIDGLALGSRVPSGAPVVDSFAFGFDSAPHTLTFGFDADASAGLGTADLTVVNLTTGATVPAAAFSMAYDEAGDEVTFAYSGVLPDGNYRATLSADGTMLDSDYSADFFVLAGDFNRDRSVNLADFTVLANNFGRSGVGFGGGDANYDGSVNLSDFTILANRFGATLPPPDGGDDGSLFA